MNSVKNKVCLKAALACCAMSSVTQHIVAETFEVMGQNLGGSEAIFGEYEQTVSPTVDPVLQDLWDRLVLHTARVRNKSKKDVEATGKTKEALMAAAQDHDNKLGPTIEQLLTSDFSRQLTEHVRKVFGEEAAQKIEQANAYLIQHHKDKGAYAFFKKKEAYLGAEKNIMDAELASGKKYPYFRIDGNNLLIGSTPEEVQLNMAKAIMHPDIIKCSDTKVAKSAFDKRKQNMSKEDAELLPFFGSPFGLNHFYALFEGVAADVALADNNKSRIKEWFDAIKAVCPKVIAKRVFGEGSSRIDKINQAKKEYNQTSLVDPKKREEALLDPIKAAHPHVFIGQEVPQYMRKSLESHFLPVHDQNTLDGTNVYLNKTVYEKYETVPLEYEKWDQGTATAVLAFPRDPNSKVKLFCSGHASTSRMEDAPLQIAAFMQAKRKLDQKRKESIPMCIEMDANTTSPKHYELLKTAVENAGLVEIQKSVVCDPGVSESDSKSENTVDKKRLLSVQEGKVAKDDANKKDYFFVTPDLVCKEFSIASSEEKLPNTKTPADHRRLRAKFQLAEGN